MWFHMKRVKSDLVGKKSGLMRGKFVAALAAESIASLPWMPLWPGTQTKVTERGLEDRVARRVWLRVTSGGRKCIGNG